MQSATKILVLSGTREGVEVIQRLQEKQVDVIASVAVDARTHVTFTAPVHFGGSKPPLADIAEGVYFSGRAGRSGSDVRNALNSSCAGPLERSMLKSFTAWRPNSFADTSATHP